MHNDNDCTRQRPVYSSDTLVVPVDHTTVLIFGTDF